MKNSQLNKVVRLITRTGDKAIVMDQETEEVLVMMPLDNYEELLDMDVPRFDGDDSGDNDRGIDFPADLDILDKLEDAEQAREITLDWDEELPKQAQKLPVEEPKKTENKPTSPIETTGTVESLADVPNDGEEEKFYLEPIE